MVPVILVSTTRRAFVNSDRETRGLSRGLRSQESVNLATTYGRIELIYPFGGCEIRLIFPRG
jgi:hypothetical protein